MHLNWETAQESNSDAFIIEKSEDGEVFYFSGKVDAAGFSRTARLYSYVDRTAASGTVYYRLKQIDRDGTFTYSAIRSVQISSSDIHISRFATNTYNIFSKENNELYVIDINGKIVIKSAHNSHNKVLYLGHLQPGLYFIKMGENYMKKILIS